MSTAATANSDRGRLREPNVVKVVVNAAGKAAIFSRRTIHTCAMSLTAP